MKERNFSLSQYWKEIPSHKRQIWFGGGGVITSRYARYTDELSYIPSSKKYIGTLRLRLELVDIPFVLPVSTRKEVSSMFGKIIFKHNFVASFSTGVACIWKKEVPAVNDIQKFSWGVPLKGYMGGLIKKRIMLGGSLGTIWSKEWQTLQAVLIALIRIH